MDPNRPLIKIEGAGLLERAKRRQDFCRVWVDGDYGQWYDGEYGGHSPAWGIARAGELKFTCAAGSVMAAYTAPGIQWYWLHKGLSGDQSIQKWSFDWTSSGTASWFAYAHPGGDISTGWTYLGTGGGATQSDPTGVEYDLSGGVYLYLNLSVYYTVGKTLTADEWIRFSPLRVYGQSTEVSIIDVLDDIFVVDGLATSVRSSGS